MNPAWFAAFASLAASCGSRTLDVGSIGMASASCTADLANDPQNCGRCAHDCCAGSCVAGVCQPAVVVSSSQLPANFGSLALDSTYLYWCDGANTGAGRILKAPKRGGATTVLASGIASPWAVAVDANFLYWATNSSTPPYGGIFKVPIGGGAIVALVASGEPGVSSIVVDETSVYWDDYGLGAQAAGASYVRKADLDGSHPETLASSGTGVAAPLLMALDSQNLYWPNRADVVQTLPPKAPTIQGIGLDGTGLMTIAQATDPYAVAVDPSWVYWSNYADGAIQKAPRSGGPAVTVAISGGPGALDVAVDSTYVYWTVQGPPYGPGGAIYFAPAAGSSGAFGQRLATSADAGLLAIDAACVYWLDPTEGAIHVVAKP